MTAAEREETIEEGVNEVAAQLSRYRSEGKKLFATSSFQKQSIPMLHILSRIDASIPIYFINTGYHFPETVVFRDQISQKFGLNTIDLQPLTPKNLQRDAHGVLYYASDPDQCCFMNKIQPLEPVLAQMDVWINGIRGDQNENRKSMRSEERTPSGALRYHPMLNWSDRMIFRYIRIHDLPNHPLEAKGYPSIGCEPCTRKFDLGDGRDGRWFGMQKTECGLHTDLVEKQ
jgi:phosphoadenosine phosphosulfate reductase